MQKYSINQLKIIGYLIVNFVIIVSDGKQITCIEQNYELTNERLEIRCKWKEITAGEWLRNIQVMTTPTSPLTLVSSEKLVGGFKYE